MSNSQFKRSEAEHHNEMYAAKRLKEQLGIPNWKDIPKYPMGSSPGKSFPVSDLCPEIFDETIEPQVMNAVNSPVILEDSDYLSPETQAALKALGSVTITPAIPQNPDIQNIQKVGRPNRETKVAVLGTGNDRVSPELLMRMAIDVAGTEPITPAGRIAKENIRQRILMATPEMLGELGRAQARKDIEEMRKTDDHL
ncbi:hypothetical protein MZD04_gp022 [Pseudomonas phage Psa21]|uniref:Uncharacterized protein n=1 Tax=Pseudomonas phage Psa21 TaxID=2530023 RepID=A0A481W4G1_9CAUD|nr:hypothetical protein MZD04_gp022 [Pseudomonas phage Psa21]QBJ02552.1 hypothetical protein PSA21_22 [Pseudomonas phage Psa21]